MSWLWRFYAASLAISTLQHNGASRVAAQILSASFSPCLQSSTQAASDQLINISAVYAQLDLTGSAAAGASEGNDAQGQGILRLVASADTGAEAEGFSNVTNYLATLIVETSLLSFVPFSNQSALCSAVLTSAQDNTTSNEVIASGNSNLTAASYPDPGGCPYGPGPLLIGYTIPLGNLGDEDFYPLTTLSTRMRILDTSVPPLQLACVDVYTTPYYFETDRHATNSASAYVYDLVLWLPVALFVAYVVVNFLGRLYSAFTTTQQEREAALASSLTAKLSNSAFSQRAKEILLETAVGRGVVRSRSLTRFVTPGPGDILGILQWMALVGMCSVRWQGFSYPIFARVGWSMLLFNTTTVTPLSRHTDPTASMSDYPPSEFQFNSGDLFTSVASPFYFSSQSSSNLLNLPATSTYNYTDADDVPLFPSLNERQGMASFAANIGLLPQDLFSNCLTFFAILLAITLVFTLVLPVLALYILRAIGRGRPRQRYLPKDQSTSSFGETGANRSSYDNARERVQSGASGGGSSKDLSGKEHHHSKSNSDARAVTPGGEGGDEYLPSLRAPSRNSGTHGGINRWWAGDKDRHSRNHHGQHRRRNHSDGGPRFEDEDGQSIVMPSSNAAYYSIRSWFAFFQGSVVRLVIFFHLPITIFSVYQLAHTSTASTVTVVFAVFAFIIVSLGIPVFVVLQIRKTMTRYLQDDTNTLLAYGSAYNTYAQDSYTFSAVRFTANLVEGCVVGGAQNRATVQVAIILAVEIIETLVTSIWLPWGEGAAQGPLQFILSVSRIITAVLLIVVSPSVSIGFTARGWVCYVIILLQAIVVILALLVLLCKMFELAFRVIAGVEFDESRNSKAGGILGAFRKKGILGFRRSAPQRSRSGKAGGDKGNRKSHTTTMGDGQAREPTRPNMHLRGQSGGAESQMGYLSASNRHPHPGMYSSHEEDDDGGYIMSAWQADHSPSAYESGYMPPGAYSAPTASQQPQSGFSVVRGGRATDSNPYMMQSNGLPPGAAAPGAYNAMSSSLSSRPPPPGIDPLEPTSLNNSAANRRSRAASQSAIVEFFNGETSPTSAEASKKYSGSDAAKDARRQSAPGAGSPRMPSPQGGSRRPASGGAPPGWRRESSTGSGFFQNLFRSTGKSAEGEADDWTDSDDSDVETLARSRRRWPFGKGKRKMSNDALSMHNMRDPEQAPREELDEEERALNEWQEATGEDTGAGQTETGDPSSAGPSTGKSFVVIRQPAQR